jgi:acetylornithine deacetylase/succinyl-diaminopimelate desuccinylase-like protein
MATDARAYAREHRARFLAELKDLIRIPTVSTLPEHRSDLERAAAWLRHRLADLGFSARVIPSGEHPIVYGEWLGAQGKPTLLCYGHYDVQPPDPLELWETPPFEPTVRGEDLYARGASDDKGQLMLQLFAIESLLRATGTLPVNVKVFIEGEEEIGSPRVVEYVPRHRRQLAADAALVCDGQYWAPGVPALVTGLRGLIYTEVEARGARHDLHSGQYGGAAPNAVEALARIVAGLKDQRGRVTIPRYYAAVEPPAPEEREAWERLGFDEQAYLAHLGVDAAPGEEGYSILERRWARPTLEVHGIAGGFTGPGAKTVIPARAVAKVSMRLVPRQRPATILRAFTRRVQALTPPGIRTEVRALSLGDPVLVPPDAPPVRLAARALQEVVGRPPVYMREGGSVPVVAAFVNALKAPAVLMGFGLPDDNLHAPNEKFHLPNFYQGIETVIRFLELLGSAGLPGRPA